MEKQNKVIYREIQKPRQAWAWILVLLMALFAWYSLIQQILLGNPVGSNPAPDTALLIFWVIFGIIFPAVLISFLKLIVEVRQDGIYIRFVPFHLHYRKFLFKDMEDYETMDYSVFEFGGWGIRVNSMGERVYTMYGNKGIKLKLKNETAVIGIQKQDEMITAMDSLLKKSDESFNKEVEEGRKQG
jgi:hypothetical protein